MSVATALNLAIAVVENKRYIVRAISRSLPLDDMSGIGQATQRLQAAVENREKQAIYAVLENVEKSSMVLEPNPNWSADYTKGWFEGLTILEQLIETEMNKIRTELGMDHNERSVDSPAV